MRACRQSTFDGLRLLHSLDRTTVRLEEIGFGMMSPDEPGSLGAPEPSRRRERS